MKVPNNRKLKFLLLFCCSVATFLSLGMNQLAQTSPQLPAPTGHVNDLAGVVDEKAKQQLENILGNLKLKTGIEFAIATVESTAGQDISDFSLKLAKDWNIGGYTSTRKSLLLVLAVKEKSSLTRFSRSVQRDLPEGVLGEMGQRMRPLVETGKFSESLVAGVQYFVSSIAQKLAFSTDDFDQAPAAVAEVSPAAADNSANKPTDEVAPAIARSTGSEGNSATVKPSATRNDAALSKPRKPNTSVVETDDSEEVVLTLTKPLEERVVLLKTFLDTHPNSQSRGRAAEYLVIARASLGDQQLKKGDRAGGIRQLTQAIAEAPVDASDKLFSVVISQIPLNLYLRGETDAAAKAAQDIEAKFGSDGRRLAILSGYYIRTEQLGEAMRLASKAVQLAPDLADAHLGLGGALRVSLRLDEALAEYKRALELDPNSKSARRSLADLDRALGKGEAALALYRQELDADPKDKAAQTGAILSLLDLGRTEEAKAELDRALQADPRNLPLLAGAAYWFVAHNSSDAALPLARRAVGVEPRYTWAQIAMARVLIAQRQPTEAERSLRFARQYGKFPTLDYELASALAAAGLYEEAAEVLSQSFSLKDGQIETRLGGQSVARNANFIDLLAPERRASIFQSVAADTENNARLLKALLAFANSVHLDNDGGAVDEDGATAAAKEFASGDDPARVHRQLFAASRLLQRRVGFQTAYELAEAARSSADAGLNVPALTIAVQADEYRAIRARAIAAGGTPDIPEAPRNVLANLLRGRIEEISGWALFNQDKFDEAVDHLKRAITILPPGTPAAQTSLWHLGVALERQDKKAEALSYYIKSYNSGAPDPVRRTLIEQLYRKVNGSLEGLDEKIGPAGAQLSAQPTAAENTPTATPTPTPESTLPSSSPSPTPEQSPASTPESTPEPHPSPTPDQPKSPTDPGSNASPVTSPTPRAETPTAATVPVDVAASRTTVAITGHVRDEGDKPIANVVVVLISPQGTVLASTTDEQGNYSFTVAPSSATRSYRIIPSKDGLSFEPVDRVLPVVSDDVKELDFVGTLNRKP